MTWIILQMIFPAMLAISPIALYKCRYRFMAKFYVAMLRSGSARRLYAQTLLIVLLLFHYVYVCGHFGDFGSVLSTILCGAMFSNRRTERWLQMLKAHRQLYFRIAVFAMLIVAIPHLYTMAVTLAFILLAAVFYPSASALYEWNCKDKQDIWRTDIHKLADCYF